MRDLPQWLMWRFMTKPGVKKPAKVPFYVNGQHRGWPRGRPRDGKPMPGQPQVAQGAELDREHLVSLDEAIRCLQRAQHWDGIGFAFLPGDGLIGVDIDAAIDLDSGEISDLCQRVVDLCGSFAEYSVSGTGVHIILTGTVEPFKDDAIGLEVYCGSQYFICTGRPWPGMPAEAQPADPQVLAYLREEVDASKARQAEQKAAEAAAARAAQPPRPAPAPRPGRTADDGVDHFRLVNDEALRALHAWVPSLLPEAVEWHAPKGWTGYRVSSKALDRKLQEDLQFSPHGIMDYGEERGYSPIDAVMKWMPSCSTPKAALEWLAGQLGITLSRRRPPQSSQAAGDHRPEPPPLDDVAPAADAPPDEPPAGDGAAAQDDAPEGGAEQAEQAEKPEPGKKPVLRVVGGKEKDKTPAKEKAKPAKKPLPPEFWELVNDLTARFALIYGTDTAYDRQKFMPFKISTLRLAFGELPVNTWLALRGRQTIDITDLVFEPGQEVEAPLINMWGGLALEPVECTADDVKPMLDLLRHLCSESQVVGPTQAEDGADGSRADDVDEVMHWILRWQALPLQQVGTKMQTACVFHGAQGTGKNMYWDVWRDLFGVYGITVGQTELDDKYNGWVSRKLAIIGDEVVSRQEMYHNKNRLKLVVTQEKKFPIRGMHQETRWESNHANVVFLSNELQPLALEDRDRRYMVTYTPLEASPELYARVRDFLAAGGAAKWLHYLQHYPLDGFDAHTKPLMTKAKADLIEAGWKPAIRFAFEWLEGYLDLPVQVCSTEQLFKAYVRWADRAGERWPGSRNDFTKQVDRWVNESKNRQLDGKFKPPRLMQKQFNLVDPESNRKRMRCWLPHGTGPLNGVSEGAWAWDCVRTFQDALNKFLYRRGVMGGGDDDGNDGS